LSLGGGDRDRSRERVDARARLAELDLLRQREQRVVLTADESADAEADERTTGDRGLPVEGLHDLFSSMGRLLLTFSRSAVAAS
jgi:hypothetical protein